MSQLLIKYADGTECTDLFLGTMEQLKTETNNYNDICSGLEMAGISSIDVLSGPILPVGCCQYTLEF